MPRTSRPRAGAPDGWTTDDWATPPEFLSALEREFGPFDLDPCATDATAKAEQYYTIAEDGLVQPWFGQVFVNPPYSAPEPWIIKAIREVAEGRARRVFLLLPNATDSGWFHNHVLRCCKVRFLRGRIRFLGPEGKPVGSPRAGNILAVVTQYDDHELRSFHL
jgi:phage N-6-adenine-methyltransferase